MRRPLAVFLCAALLCPPASRGENPATPPTGPLTAEELLRWEQTVSDSFGRARLEPLPAAVDSLRDRLPENPAALEPALRRWEARRDAYRSLLRGVAEKNADGVPALVAALKTLYPDGGFADDIEARYKQLALDGVRSGSAGTAPKDPAPVPGAEPQLASMVGFGQTITNSPNGGSIVYDGGVLRRPGQDGPGSADMETPRRIETVDGESVIGAESSSFKGAIPQLRVGEVPLRETPAAARYDSPTSRFMTGVRLAADDALAEVSLPGPLDRALDVPRQRARQDAYKLRAREVRQDRAERANALLTTLGAGEVPAGSKETIDGLAARYAAIGEESDPEKRRGLLREYLTAADAAMGTLDVPALASERTKTETVGTAESLARGALDALAAEASRAEPAMAPLFAKLKDAPETLSEAEMLRIGETVKGFAGTPAHALYASALGDLESARTDLAGFYRDNPGLLAYYLDKSSAQRFHWQNLLSGAVPDGVEFNPGELGMAAGEGARIRKATQGGREGLWTVSAGETSFKSFDGRLTVEDRADSTGAPVRITTTVGDRGGIAVEIAARDEKSAWRRRVGRLVDGKIVIDRTELADGRAMVRVDDLTTEVLGADGKRQGLEVSAEELSSRRGAAREAPARAMAASLAGALGWETGRAGALASWLRDGFTLSEGERMRLTALPDGTVQVIYEYPDGRRRIETAQFAGATRFQGRSMGEALVVLSPARVNPDGTSQFHPKRWREYLPGGDRLVWQEAYRTEEAGIFSSMKSVTQVSVLHERRNGSGVFDGAFRRVDRREDLDIKEDIATTSTAGMVGAAIHDVPVLGHALDGLGWIGNRGYNGVVGGYQMIIGEAADSAIYRVHGRAGRERMLGASQEEWERVARGFGREERAIIDGEVRRVRGRMLRRQGLTAERTLPSFQNNLLNRPVSDAERGAALAGDIGATTYGQLFADWAAETDGPMKGVYTTAGIGMTALEMVPQTLPVIVALGGLGRLGGAQLPANAGRLMTGTVTAARYTHMVMSPYVMTTWGVNIPVGINDFVEGLQDGDASKTARAGGQAVVDTFFLAAAAKGFRDTLARQRANAQAKILAEAMGREALVKPTEGLPRTEVDQVMTEAAQRVERYETSRRTDGEHARIEIERRNTRALEERAEVREIYDRALEIGRGKAESPVPDAARAQAIAEGKLIDTGGVVMQKAGCATCGLNTFAKQLRSAGVETTVPAMLKVVESRLGPELAAKARNQGLTPLELDLVHKAVAMEHNVGLRTIPRGELFSFLESAGRDGSAAQGAMVTIRTGRGYHQVTVEGTVLVGGKTMVSFVDPVLGRNTYMPVEAFARLARSDGVIASAKPPAAAYGAWESRIADYRAGKLPTEADNASVRSLVEGRESTRVGADPATPVEVLGQLQRFLQDPVNMGKVKDSSSAFSKVVDKILDPSRGPQGRVSESQAVALQRAYKAKLDPAIKGVLERYNMTEAEVTSHGTTLRSAMGMLFEGGIRATQGFGDGAQIWAAKGTGGASYTARASGKGEPGALVIMDNRGNRQNHRIDFVERARAMEDFLAIIVTDGTNVVVLDRVSIMSLASSAAKMKSVAADYNRPGWKMSDLERWEALGRRLGADRQ